MAMLAISCDVSYMLPSGPGLPTTAPGALQAIIAGTAGAAQTQTAEKMPPPSTPTLTPTPTRVPSATPTWTPTFIYVIPKGPGPTAKPGTTATAEMSSSQYACDLLAQDPEDGTRFNPKVSFDGVWEVRNIGTKNWPGTNVDFVYVTGDKFHEQAVYDLSDTVQPGKSIDLIVDMVAPKKAGTYETEWALRRSGQLFCHLTMTIVVK